MKVGRNPLQLYPQARRPQQITLSMVVCIPFEAGYFEDSLDVLKLSLESLINHTDLPYDLMVFDNGSCSEVVTYLNSLRTQGRIQYLILSDRNLGKLGAWNAMFQAAPGEFIGYSDYDIFFYPEWLSAHQRIFDVFPRVGMVTGRPTRSVSANRDATMRKTISLLEADTETRMERGRFISEDLLAEHAMSRGQAPEIHAAATDEIEDVRVHRRGVTAFVNAGHFQFVTKKEVVSAVLPFESYLTAGGEITRFDSAIIEQEYLLLSTENRYVRHMGNKISPEMARTAKEFGLTTPSKTFVSTRPAGGIARRLADLPPVRRLSMAAYNRIFRLYYG